jgi:hypothetical protein
MKHSFFGFECSNKNSYDWSWNYGYYLRWGFLGYFCLFVRIYCVLVSFFIVYLFMCAYIVYRPSLLAVPCPPSPLMSSAKFLNSEISIPCALIFLTVNGVRVCEFYKKSIKVVAHYTDPMKSSSERHCQLLMIVSWDSDIFSILFWPPLQSSTNLKWPMWSFIS